LNPPNGSWGWFKPEKSPKGLGIPNHLLPVNGLLLSVGQAAQLLLDLLPLSRQLLTARLELGPVDDLGLKGIQQALRLSFEPRPPLRQLRLLRRQRGKVLLFGGDPVLMQWRNQAGLRQQPDPDRTRRT
jgi:hypothetical protein